MAKVLPEWPKPEKRVGHRGPTRPWDDWLDGQVWELEAGTDFISTPLSFRKTVLLRAAQRQVRVRTQVRFNGNMVIQKL